MTIALAFYKGKGTFVDWCIRTATRSKFSHVELFYGDIMAREATCYSSSARDGGVRCKNINISSEHWDILYVDFTPKFDPLLFNRNINAKYDYLGILLSQFFNFRTHDKDRWFCSEICAAMMGLPAPESYSPGQLFDTINLTNLAHLKGVEQGCDLPTASLKS